uniref:Hemoglobin subunit beta-2-like n=1 Tax=Geotrypetes seraphini TaxID=260995 RepID=A0A6P8RFI8_GEOSA|nr:hemoglobin subunit beta-2-like [Geotrypetes seraphini]
MVCWTSAEKAAINCVWQKVDVEKEGPEILSRVMVVYPWTQRYFPSFGNMSSPAAIINNAKVSAHGKKVLFALGEAVSHLDNIKGTFAKLSEFHADILHVDPHNFKLLNQTLVIVLARKLGSAFTMEVQAAWEKFVAVVSAALAKGYQ